MDQVSQIRDRTDIVTLISSYIPLKKMGNNYKANCPFHGEKTPSFVVSPERQIWHCFGCSKGGDCFTFLMEYEHIEFPEALRMLADKAGVELQQKGYDTGLSSKKELIYKLNALAAEFYHFLLTKHAAGKEALDYLVDKRKIKTPTITTYMLGYSPFGNVLTSYLTKKKQYKLEDIVESGLATKRYNGIIGDFFQGRLMFPLYDHRGNVIGFSGRVLQDDEKTSKYINTRETLVYHKGQVFFGLNSSKEQIKKENKAIVMEGEFDVIAAFQEGITNTVAIKGTAFTPEQAHLIARFAKTVTMCLDGDNAGQEAIKRSLPILEKENLTTTIIVIPNGKDPDESIKSDPILFKKAVKNDVPVYDVLLQNTFKKFDPTSALGKKQIGEELLPHIGVISNEIVKEHYLQKLSREIDTPVDVLQKQIDRLAKKEIIKREVEVEKIFKSRDEGLEEYIVSLVVQSEDPYIVLTLLPEFFNEYRWLFPSYEKVLVLLRNYATKERAFVSKEFLATLPEELIPVFDTCFLLPLPTFQNDDYFKQEVKKAADELLNLGIKREIKHLTQLMEKEEATGNEEQLGKLQGELSHYLALLKAK